MQRSIAFVPLFAILLPACPADDAGGGDTSDTATATDAASASASATTTGTMTDATPTSETVDPQTTTGESSTGSGSTGEGTTGTSAETTGEQTGSSGTGSEALAIIGEYTDNFGGSHEVTMTTWVFDTGGFGVITTDLQEHDNDAGWVAGEDVDTPGAFSRFDWTYDGDGTLWYCTAVFEAESLEAAIGGPPSDPSDPSVGGCGGMFAWTMLTPA